MGGACCLHDRGVQKLTLNMLCPFLTSPGEGRPQHYITEDFAYEFTPKLIFLQIQYISLFLHSDEAVMQFTLSDYNQRQDYMDAIDNVQYKAGGTNTAAALNMIRNQGKLITLSQKKSKYL